MIGPIRALEDLTRPELAVIVREYLLGGQLIDRAGMPHVIAAHGREVMGEIAIDEWMGASPIYTRRMQQVLGFAGDDVETIFKGMQFDIGAPPEFMDFRYRVIDEHHGEFWLDHCGALMDVEPMGADYVQTMCHTIEDPTFDATACATNPRARMTPLHRPPRTPADRHPHCHWQVQIIEDAEPLEEPEPAVRMARTRLAHLPLHLPGRFRSDHEGGDQEEGWGDYAAPLDPDLRTEAFSRSALLAIAHEVGVQTHLLVMSFLDAVERRSSVEAAVEIGARQFAGVAGVVARRIRSGLGSGDGLAGVAQVVELHPAFQPRTYVDWSVRAEGHEGSVERLTLHLSDCDALQESGVESWMSILANGHHAALDAVVQAVDPFARCRPVRPEPGEAAAWEVVLGDEPAEESADVSLTAFSTGSSFQFSESPVTIGGGLGSGPGGRRLPAPQPR